MIWRNDAPTRYGEVTGATCAHCGTHITAHPRRLLAAKLAHPCPRQEGSA